MGLESISEKNPKVFSIICRFSHFLLDQPEKLLMLSDYFLITPGI